VQFFLRWHLSRIGLLLVKQYKIIGNSMLLGEINEYKSYVLPLNKKSTLKILLLIASYALVGVWTQYSKCVHY